MGWIKIGSVAEAYTALPKGRLTADYYYNETCEELFVKLIRCSQQKMQVFKEHVNLQGASKLQNKQSDNTVDLLNKQ